MLSTEDSTVKMSYIYLYYLLKMIVKIAAIYEIFLKSALLREIVYKV